MDAWDSEGIEADLRYLALLDGDPRAALGNCSHLLATLISTFNLESTDTQQSKLISRELMKIAFGAKPESETLRAARALMWPDFDLTDKQLGTVRGLAELKAEISENDWLTFKKNWRESKQARAGLAASILSSGRYKTVIGSSEKAQALFSGIIEAANDHLRLTLAKPDTVATIYTNLNIARPAASEVPPDRLEPPKPKHKKWLAPTVAGAVLAALAIAIFWIMPAVRSGDPAPLVSITAVPQQPYGAGGEFIFQYWLPADTSFDNFPYDHIDFTGSCTKEEIDWITSVGGEPYRTPNVYEIKNLSNAVQQVNLQDLRRSDDSVVTEPQTPGFVFQCNPAGGMPRMLRGDLDLDSDAPATVVMQSETGDETPLGPTFYNMDAGETLSLLVWLSGANDFAGSITMDTVQGDGNPVPETLPVNGSDTFTRRGLGSSPVILEAPGQGSDDRPQWFCAFDSNTSPNDTQICQPEDVATYLKTHWSPASPAKSAKPVVTNTSVMASPTPSENSDAMIDLERKAIDAVTASTCNDPAGDAEKVGNLWAALGDTWADNPYFDDVVMTPLKALVARCGTAYTQTFIEDMGIVGKTWRAMSAVLN